jgi:hypothetical protein
VDLTRTRTALHGVAELLLAGPQYAASGTIRLRVVPGGIATVADPDLRLEGDELEGPQGRQPLRGSYAEVGTAVGVMPRRLDDVYSDPLDVAPEEPIELDRDDLVTLLDALEVGDTALRMFAPGAEPVLWPEHLDVAITLDEVTFGVSPGDALLPAPYAYVGPWEPRSGPFWDQPFGAARPLSSLAGVDGVAAFFREGVERAAADPRADEAAR